MKAQARATSTFVRDVWPLRVIFAAAQQTVAFGGNLLQNYFGLQAGERSFQIKP